MTLTARRRNMLLATRGLRADPACVAYWRADHYSAALDALEDLGPHRKFHLVFGATTNAPLRLVNTGRKYLYLPGSGTNYCHCPDSVPLSFSGDLDLMVNVELADYTPGATHTLLAKFAGAGTRSYALNLNTNGTLQLILCTDGTNSFDGGLATAATGVTDGTQVWLRGTLDADDGAGNRVAKFYKSTDPPDTPRGSIQWTQIGTTVTTVGAVTLFDGNALFTVGAHTNGTSGLVAGKVFRAIAADGYDGAGTIQADINFGLANAAPSTFTEQSANAATVTIVRSGTGRKSTVVDQTLLLLGQDDYLAVADTPEFDFAGPFTIALACRHHDTPSFVETYFNKRNIATNESAGYTLSQAAGSVLLTGRISDGTNTTTDTVSSAAGYALTGLMVLRRNVNAVTVEVDHRTTFAAGTADTNTASIANALAFEVGRNSTPNYAHVEVLGGAAFNRYLTTPEVRRLAYEFGCAA